MTRPHADKAEPKGSVPGDPCNRLRRPFRTRLSLAVAVASLAAAALAWRVVPYHVDDAFINYRYARNVIAGRGLAFNLSGEPVEGFSSPAWLALLVISGLAWGPAALPLAAMVSGLVAMVCCLSVVGLANRDRPSSKNPSGSGGGTVWPWASVISLGLLATLPTFCFYGVTGLETVGFLVTVLTFAAAVDGTVALRWGAAAGVMAAWVRPEGPWFLTAMLAQMLALGSPAGRWRRGLVLAGSVFFGAAVLVAVRWAVFSELLPNTYYAKKPVLSCGTAYLFQSFSTPWQRGGPWAASLLVLGLVGALLAGGRSRGYFAAGLAWIVAAWIEGGDWMPHGRLFLPAFGLFALSAGGIAEIRRLGRGRATNWAAVGATLIALGCALNGRASWLSGDAAQRTCHGIQQEGRILAGWLQISGAKSVALVDVGDIGYRTGLEILDLGGLTDRTIARSPGTHLAKNVDWSYLFEYRRPDVVVIQLVQPPLTVGDTIHFLRGSAHSPTEEHLMADPRMSETYRPLFALVPNYRREPYYGRLVLIRRGFQPSENSLPSRPVVTIGPLPIPG